MRSGPERWAREQPVRDIDALAYEGFSRAAESYDRARPGYAVEAVDWMCVRLGITRESLVLDLGAGTGKLALLLRERSASRVIAVEPVPEMREIAAVHGLGVLDGSAESLPVADDSVDAVVCGEAFHWFDGKRALHEIGRALVPGGGLGLLWNLHLWDRNASWVQAIERLLAPHADRRTETRYSSGRWQRAFERDRHWTRLEGRSFAHEQRLEPAALVDHVASVAFVAALPDRQRAELLAEVGRVVADLPAPVTIPYRTDAYVSTTVS
jgi:ubiquinone/menaquinone biosynthesis C-methylase UbiE